MSMDSTFNNLDELVDLDEAFITNCQYLDITDDNVMVQNLENSIKIAHLNVHSLLSKYDTEKLMKIALETSRVHCIM